MNATETKPQPRKRVDELLQAEQRMGINHPSYFKSEEREG